MTISETGDVDPILTRVLSDQLPTLPYPGIRAFEEQDWPIFFGREAIVAQLLERLSDNRFVAVVGASGDGKSSLVKAGLFATLKHKHARLGVRWRTATMRPAGSPMWSLAEALQRATRPESQNPEQQASVAEIEPYRAALARGPHAIEAILRDGRNSSDQNLLLLVDQFEELFRYDILGGEAEVRIFLDQLADAIENPPAGFYLALTMRSEYLGDCARHPRFADILNRSSYLLRRMRRTELTEAIAKPAELFGGRVEPALLQRLLSDALGESDHLPLLQHALMWLWIRESENLKRSGQGDAAPELLLAAYEKAVGLTGTLSEHANIIFDGLAGPQGSAERRRALQLAAKRLFQALSEVQENGRVTRRPRRFAELMAETGLPETDLLAVVEAFRAPGHSFLMPPSSVLIDKATVIDVSHEALIRRWDKLKDWLAEEQADASIWDRFRVSTQNFINNSRRLLNVEEAAEFQSFWDRRAPTKTWRSRYSDQTAQPIGPEGGTHAADPLADNAARLLVASRRREFRRKLAIAAGVMVGFAAIVFAIVYFRTSSLLVQEQALRLRAQAATERANAIAQQAEKTNGELQKIVSALQAAADATPSDGALQNVIEKAQSSIENQREQLAKSRTTSAPSDVGRYTVFLHTGGGPIALSEQVKDVLEKQGYKVRVDTETDQVGGPGVDFFDNQDTPGAANVAAVVNSALPVDIRRLRPRRQSNKNPPGFLGVWLFDRPLIVDRDRWNAGPPQAGWCFQQDRSGFEKGADNFLVNCYRRQEDCRSVRNSARGTRSACVVVSNLPGTQWKPGRGASPPGPDASMSWYQYSPAPMGPPFPQIEND
jgi:hypothetical protein